MLEPLSKKFAAEVVGVIPPVLISALNVTGVPIIDGDVLIANCVIE
jgi:hypothetical protein